MGFAGIHFILYRWFPVSFDPFPLRYSISGSTRIILVVCLGIPTTILFFKALQDAGKETLTPDKEHSMYKGTYNSIRHPQAVAEVISWFILALLLDSPFLTFVCFIYLLIWVIWCFLEEKDLLVRYKDAYVAYQNETGMFFPKFKRTKKKLPH